MKVFKFRNRSGALFAAALLVSSAAFAQKTGIPPRIVTWNCSGCHGLGGNSQQRYFPSLAGLNADYAARRILEFKATASPPVDRIFSRVPHVVSPVTGASRFEASVNMVGIAHALTNGEIRAASAWYAVQTPTPGRSGDPAPIEAGRLVYLNGVPAQGVPSCKTCHGPDGQGVGKTPRLAGQNSGYLLGELGKFNAGDRKHAPEMTMVAHNLDVAQIQAVASFLQSR